MTEHQTTDAESLDTYAAGFEFEPMVGLTILPGHDRLGDGNYWLSWDETVALSEWLAKMVEAARD